MGRLVPSDDLPGAMSPMDSALRAEGVSGRVADIARSIYQQESGSGRNTTTSNAGAVGGMQIIPATFNRMADKGWAIDNPEQNARAGVRYIQLLHDKAGGDPALTATGYYGGEGAIDKARRGVAVSDPRNPNAPNTLQYGQQVAARLPAAQSSAPVARRVVPDDDLPDVVPAAAKPAAPAESGGFMQDVKQGVGNVVAGAVRGAGSIGATLLAPVDLAARAVNNGKPLTIGGNEIIGQDRRAGMDAGLQTLGADPDSLMYKGGKILGEVAGTAGAGGVVANGLLRAAPAAVAASPRLAQLVEATRSSGLTLGGTAATTSAGRAADFGVRAAGGALSGAAQGGLIDPQQMGMSAAIGGAAPGVLQGLGFSGNALSRVINGPGQSAEVLQAVKAARDAGYVIPPTQASPTLTNRLLEGFSGKLTTAQNASAKNAGVTDSLASQALGLAPDVKITPDVLTSVRKTAGQAYDAIGQTGAITPAASYTQALDDIAAPFLKTAQSFPNAKVSPVIELVESLKSPSFDAASAVEKIKQLRTAADDAFRSGNTDMARASKSAAKAMEDAVESHLQTIGQPALLQNFRDARQLIAKTYTVEKALNTTTGTVDARKLGALIQRGKPLTDELKQAGDFANRFPKAAQTVEQMGSLPQSSPLDWAVSGGISAATANPLMMAGVVARPAARALSLSGMVQNRLATPAGNNRLAELMQNPELQQFLLKSAPVAGAR